MSVSDDAAAERRDWRRHLTGHALQGLLGTMQISEGGRYIGLDEFTAESIAREAVMVADAALNALADVEQGEVAAELRAAEVIP